MKQVHTFFAALINIIRGKIKQQFFVVKSNNFHHVDAAHWYFWWILLFFHICKYVIKTRQMKEVRFPFFYYTLQWFEEFFNLRKFQTIVKFVKNITVHSSTVKVDYFTWVNTENSGGRDAMYVKTFFTKRIHRKLAQGSKVVLTHKLSLLKLAWPAFGILYLWQCLCSIISAHMAISSKL